MLRQAVDVAAQRIPQQQMGHQVMMTVGIEAKGLPLLLFFRRQDMHLLPKEFLPDAFRRRMPQMDVVVRYIQAVPTEKVIRRGLPSAAVLVRQSPNMRKGNNAAPLRRLNLTWFWALFGQRQLGSGPQAIYAKGQVATLNEQ